MLVSGTLVHRQSTDKMNDQDESNISDSEASKIGSFIAEMGQDQANVQKNR